MMSINRQCSDAVELLYAIQACVARHDAGAWATNVIPCREEDFKVYIARARELLSIDDPRRRS